LEVDNSSHVLENCIVDGVTVHDGNIAVGLRGVSGASLKDNLISNLTMKDGPTSAVNIGVVVEQAARTIVRGFTADVAMSSYAVAVIDSDDTLISDIHCEGTFSDPGILLHNTDRTLVTGCNLKNNATQTYAVQESGTCTATTVTGNLALEGATAPVLLGGTGSRSFGNGGVSVQTYAASNVTTDRTYNANSTTTDELADVLGTLIADLRAQGIVA
jgi:hypothetical protein